MLRRPQLLALSLLPLAPLPFVRGAAPPRASAAPPRASSGPPAPPPPAAYDVTIRYQIFALPAERLRQYREMMRYLTAAGFRRDPEAEVPETEPEDPNATRLSGTIASKDVDRLLRERHVRALLLTPRGGKLPEDKKQAVRVDVRLRSGLAPGRQRQVHGQTARLLGGLG